MGGIPRLGRDVGNAGERSTRQGSARGQTARRGTAGRLKTGAGDSCLAGRHGRHWCRHRQFLAEFRWLLNAGFQSVLIAERRLVLLAGLQPLLPAKLQSRRCTSSADPGSGPRTGSGCPGGTAGHSDIAGAKRRCVDVAHAERLSPTGGFEKNNPSTLLADGAGELPAESGGAADDVQHLTVDDFQHPTSKSSRADHPGVAKSTPTSSSRQPPPPLPKPAGPFSVGGAPLSPAPAPGSGAS